MIGSKPNYQKKLPVTSGCAVRSRCDSGVRNLVGEMLALPLIVCRADKICRFLWSMREDINPGNAFSLDKGRVVFNCASSLKKVLNLHAKSKSVIILRKNGKRSVLNRS